MRSHGPPLVYVDTYLDGVDILTERTERAHPFQREYVDDQGKVVTIVEDVAQMGPRTRDHGEHDGRCRIARGAAPQCQRRASAIGSRPIR